MNPNKKFLALVAALTITLFAAGCGGESKEEKQANEQAAQAEQEATAAKKQARKEAKQAKMEANEAKKMSLAEKKQAKAAATAQANEQNAEAQASESATEAANAEAAATAAAAKKKKSAAAGSGGGTASAGGSQDCGGGIEVNAVTSCAFAKNVVAAWKKDEGPSVSAYSPDTGETYNMSCSGSQMLTTCTGGAGAKVTFTP